jgi:predicted NACHT family NTPase
MLALTATVPPALGGAGLWVTAEEHPVHALAALLMYEAVIVLAGIAVQAHGELKKHWAAHFTEAIEAALRRRFSRYGRRYRRFLAEAHHDVDLRGPAVRGVMAMDRVFVDISLVPRPDAADSGPAGSPGSVWAFLQDSERRALAIIGAPGGGKTTLLKHMALVLARNRRAGWPLGAPRHKTPILLFLREHGAEIAADPTVSLPELVRRSARFARAAEPPHWFDQQLETGRCVVLLDGLDEVAREEDRRMTVDWVERQIAAYPGCRFALTSRPCGYDARPLNPAVTLQIRPFTPEQVGWFVHRWYSAMGRRPDPRGDGADELLGRLRAIPGLSELATSPLLLTMIANVHFCSGTLADRRDGLYREFCRQLLGRRSKMIGMGPELSLAQKEGLLRVLAAHLMENEIRGIAATAAADVIAPVLAGIRPLMDPQDFLSSVGRTSGLLLEREDGLYRFAHQALQEYLAASYILEVGRLDLLLRNLDRGWWRETILFYCAQTDASPIVGACLKDQAPTSQALALAKNLVGEARHLEPDLRRRWEELSETVDPARTP